MSTIHDRLVSAIDSLLHISGGPSLDEFVAAYPDSAYPSTELLDDDIALPLNLASDIDFVCQSLMEASIADDDWMGRLKRDLGAVKTHLIPIQDESSPSRNSSPTPSSSSSRESSPTPSRRASPRPSFSTSPTAGEQQPPVHVPLPQEEVEIPTASLPPPPTLSSRVRVPPPLTNIESGMSVFFFPFLSLTKSFYSNRLR
ncbi:hypothetical protein CPB85DRAFT_1346815 [Mucidula mucida]|nr:hypothetical protein CPB85DRAFT_1346815 [Mucidula mucida]